MVSVLGSLAAPGSLGLAAAGGRSGGCGGERSGATSAVVSLVGVTGDTWQTPFFMEPALAAPAAPAAPAGMLVDGPYPSGWG